MLFDDDVVADREAKPGPSPVGLVVKKGLNILSFTAGAIPVPLSRILISTRSPRFLVAAVRVGSWSPPLASVLRGRCVEAVRDKVQQGPCDILRVDVGCTSGGIQ